MAVRARSVLVALVLAAVPAGTALAAAKNVLYTGTTSEGRAVSFGIKGGVVNPFRAKFTALCMKGTARARATGPVTVRNLKLRHGAFTYHGPVVAGNRRAPFGRGRATIDGAFTGRHKAAGSFTLDITLTNGFRCRTGTVTFHARSG